MHQVHDRRHELGGDDRGTQAVHGQVVDRVRAAHERYGDDGAPHRWSKYCSNIVVDGLNIISVCESQ